MQEGHPLQIGDLLPFGLSLDETLIVGAVIVVGGIVLSMGDGVFKPDRMQSRLKMIAERRAELKGTITAARRRKKTTQHDSAMGWIRQVVSQLKLLKQHQAGSLQHKLTQGGFRSKDAMVIYAFAKLVMPMFGLLIGLIAAGIDWSNAFSIGQASNWLVFLCIGYFGARLPDFVVSNAMKNRHHKIRKALPDALDLMMICAEAGLSLTASLERVARELGRVSPELAEEFNLTSVELGFLPERAQALRHLADRVDIKEIRGFVNVIVQTEKYGTPIAQALRVLSKEFRTERMLRAEQKAARLPAMMTVPMIVFILPTLFVIVMTPAVISVMDNF